MKSKRKAVATVIADRSYTVFEQRQPLKKEYGGKVYYEANLLRIGQVEAQSATQAMEVAKKRGLTDKPIIWGPETEAMRDIYHRNQRQQDD